MTISTDYDSLKIKSIVGSNQMTRMMVGAFYKHFSGKKLQQSIKGDFDLELSNKNYEEISSLKNSVPIIVPKHIWYSPS